MINWQEVSENITAAWDTAKSVDMEGIPKEMWNVQADGNYLITALAATRWNIFYKLVDHTLSYTIPMHHLNSGTIEHKAPKEPWQEG